MTTAIALVDCRTFYVSCERLFSAAARGKATIVLGNNDGCIVALSAEAKALGLKRGQPVFECREIINANGVVSFSSNYPLYSDISARVMTTLALFTSTLEIYSIDEGFLDVSHVEPEALSAYGKQIQRTVLQHTGIFTTVAIAPTKTLTKIAAEIIKLDAWLDGVLSIVGRSETEIDELLERIQVTEIWNIGEQRARKLWSQKLYTARAYKYAPPAWVRKNLHVTGARTQLELQGRVAIPLEPVPKPKKNVACALSFGRPVLLFEELVQALANYVVNVARRLRKQGSLATSITIFIQTSRFENSSQRYSRSCTRTLLFPTAYPPDLIACAIEMLRDIFRPGFRYRKVGVMLGKVVSQEMIQGDLFDLFSSELHARKMRLMQTVDELCDLFGNNAIFFGSQGIQRDWQMRQARRSAHYTTNWEELFTVE